MNRILRTIASVALIASALSVSAQEKTIVFADWNIRSFEKSNGAGHNVVPVDEYVAFIKTFNADIITFNEFETVTAREGAEKMAEVAKELGMFGYFIESYPKVGDGFYGNVILSKWPIINTASRQMTYKNYKGEGYYQFNSDPELEQYGADQRSVGYADILVPVSATESKILRVVSSHFDNMGAESVRTRQASESVEFAGLANPPYPTVMMGDLNTSRESVLQPLFAVGDHIGYYWVDHVFTFPKGKFTKVKWESPSSGLLSDHEPVIATLKVTL